MDLCLTAGARAALLPMHLLMAPDGTVLDMGPTLRKLPGGDAAHVSGILAENRPGADADLPRTIRAAAGTGQRLFLRLVESPRVTLRGHVVVAADGALLLNLGFGISLVEAVRHAGLTDRDFAPPELAMELLFLHEANRGVLDELSRFNKKLAAAREVAELQAHTDPLTGLTNRRGLELALATALRQVRDRKGPGFALAHLDLDHFKEVNDHLGHAAGDRLLCDVAGILREAVRSHDTAARIGGDEFVLILRDLNDVGALERLARRIIDRIGQRVSAYPGVTPVSASIGIVLSGNYSGQPAERILHDADVALYRSKNGGRGRTTILSEPLPDEG